MDEGLLNDLLECSVCLERLDTSSRVLPCQHTFCLKCLKVIVESHKELRCPECRVLVEVRVEELPPNVLLMRILEGMKNAPRKITTTRNRTGHSQASSILHQSSRLDKQPPPHGRAIYDFVSKEPGDLSFKKGETILLQKKLDTFWFHGECSGRTGLFPITYVQVVVPLPVPTALCKALYDFRMSAPDEEGCLAFDKGAIITVHRRVDENWAEGRLEQRVGIFPIAFVELNHAARMLMNSAPLNRPVPPIPEQPRPGHSDHRYHVQHPHRYQQMTLSTPTTGVQGNYPNVSTMSQSHPNYHAQSIVTPQQILVPQQVNQHVAAIGSLVSTVPRNLLEQQTKNSLDLIYHFTNVHNKSHQTIVQSVPRIGENYDRLRAAKFDNYTNPVQKAETPFQNMGPSVMRAQDHVPVTDFTNFSSDSSSSVNTPPGVVGSSSTTTPNTSSNTSTCESAEPSLPSSPDNNAERTSTVAPPNSVQNETEPDTQDSLNASIGVLSLNESSTATNTSLNVSLPPSESPKLIACNGSSSAQNQNESQDTASNNEPSRLEVPSSSKNVRSSGPDSLLNFGLGLQAALSPSHREGNYMVSRGHREHHREREKRHSLTPSSHLQGNHTQNRHSAEILATSLLDTTERERPERDRDRPERERERRRRRSRSNERPLPAAYIALYPYKPQKPDELELKKGGIYTVTERCRDGWYKGCGERAARGGVFPGNYVAPLTAAAPSRQRHDQSTPSKAPGPPAPDAPPRAASPQHPPGQPITHPWITALQPQQITPRSEKSKDKIKAEKSSISTGVSLMKRLTAMKKCKSPPPVGYSMDNPVFDDGPGTSLMPHPVHVRSGSCPSQLLRALPAARLRHDRLHSRGSGEAEWGHRKSASLDVSRRERHAPAKEKFRCIVPYPPNSEYELELKIDDIVIVCKKRGDGWYKGTLQRTGRTGLFPASFVQSCPPE